MCQDDTNRLGFYLYISDKNLGRNYMGYAGIRFFTGILICTVSATNYFLFILRFLA